MKLNETTLSFWNECHISKNGMGLTGSEYNKTINFLKLNDYLRTGLKVLEIGIGMGYTIKGFSEMGCFPSAVDVSKIALEKIEKYCEKTYTPDNMIEMPENYFDIIIVFNTVQHIYTDLLIFELKNCLRSLKPDGIMAIQFVSTPRVKDDSGLDKNTNTGESFFRNKEYFAELIKSFGGSCEFVYEAIRFYSKDWPKDRYNSGYGEIEYSSEFVSIPIPVDVGQMPFDMITGNHVVHVRKNNYKNNDI